MRVVAEIPHPVMKISIFAWNEKYHLKFEAGPFEQTYKIGQMDLSGVDELKAMVDDDFCNAVLERFVAMRADFGTAWKKSQNTPS
jgi:hypothetical protein